MGAADWTQLDGGLVPPLAAAGATSGLQGPRGGGRGVFAMHALTDAIGAVGLRATPTPPTFPHAPILFTDYDPMILGGEISIAMARRGAASAFAFVGLAGTSVADRGYLLGLSDGSPAAHIELRKGVLQQGLPDESPGNLNTVLRRSTTFFEPGTWTHVKLEVVVAPNGDVVLNCYRNDLAERGVDAPVWEEIPGFAGTTVIDDVTGVNTGSTPLVGGRAGFAARFNGEARAQALFAAAAVVKQLPPF